MCDMNGVTVQDAPSISTLPFATTSAQAAFCACALAVAAAVSSSMSASGGFISQGSQKVSVLCVVIEVLGWPTCAAHRDVAQYYSVVQNNIIDPHALRKFSSHDHAYHKTQEQSHISRLRPPREATPKAPKHCLPRSKMAPPAGDNRRRALMLVVLCALHGLGSADEDEDDQSERQKHSCQLATLQTHLNDVGKHCCTPPGPPPAWHVFQARIGSQGGIPTRTYDFKIAKLSNRGGSYSDRMAEECNKYKMKPVCDHPSYCRNDHRALWIGQSSHLAYKPNRNNYHQMGAVRDKWNNLCSYTNRANGNNALCNIPINSHAWRNPGQYNPGFMCAKGVRPRHLAHAVQNGLRRSSLCLSSVRSGKSCAEEEQGGQVLQDRLSHPQNFVRAPVRQSPGAILGVLRGGAGPLLLVELVQALTLCLTCTAVPPSMQVLTALRMVPRGLPHFCTYPLPRALPVAPPCLAIHVVCALALTHSYSEFARRQVHVRSIRARVVWKRVQPQKLQMQNQRGEPGMLRAQRQLQFEVQRPEDVHYRLRHGVPSLL